jgi:hypothetical protein
MAWVTLVLVAQEPNAAAGDSSEIEKGSKGQHLLIHGSIPAFSSGDPYRRQSLSDRFIFPRLHPTR